jgi:protein-disulfide isomerase
MSKLSIPVTNKDHKQGNPNTRCTLVEYGDYECPYCGQAYPIVKRLQKHFGSELLVICLSQFSTRRNTSACRARGRSCRIRSRQRSLLGDARSTL